MTLLVPVILAGGAGTRLWPVSREFMPKHLAKLIGEDSLLQRTATRVIDQASASQLVTVAAKSQDLLIRRQLAAINPDLTRHRLLEPLGRNTAAAIALAALHVKRVFGSDAILWVCPSDHLIRDEAELRRAVADALPVAADGDLLTFGITPTRPETGYGYIKTGMPTGEASKVLRVDRFVEKPDLNTAKAMLAAGGYFWNSGMFLFRADRILEELGEHEPDLVAATEAAFKAAAVSDDGAIDLPSALYEKIPSAPIDKAVMERAKRIAVVPCNPEWTDLGSWHSIWEQSSRDARGNAAYGDVLLNNVDNCLIHTSHRLVACASVKDLAIIETDDALLVADRERSEPIKEIVATLNKADRTEAVQHQAVDHAWGRSAILDHRETGEVRRLEIAAGQSLDQLEGRDRPLHWLVIEGRGELCRDDQTTPLAAGASADLPPHVPYSLVNPTDSPLTLIEVARPHQ